jgi:prolyl-tRNA synthetase
LIGIPLIVVVGRRLAEGFVEVRDRPTGDRVDVPLSEVEAEVLRRVAMG